MRGFIYVWGDADTRRSAGCALAVAVPLGSGSPLRRALCLLREGSFARVGVHGFGVTWAPTPAVANCSAHTSSIAYVIAGQELGDLRCVCPCGRCALPVGRGWWALLMEVPEPLTWGNARLHLLRCILCTVPMAAG